MPRGSVEARDVIRGNATGKREVAAGDQLATPDVQRGDGTVQAAAHALPGDAVPTEEVAAGIPIDRPEGATRVEHAAPAGESKNDFREACRAGDTRSKRHPSRAVPL